MRLALNEADQVLVSRQAGGFPPLLQAHFDWVTEAGTKEQRIVVSAHQHLCTELPVVSMVPCQEGLVHNDGAPWTGCAEAGAKALRIGVVCLIWLREGPSVWGPFERVTGGGVQQQGWSFQAGLICGGPLDWLTEAGTKEQRIEASAHHHHHHHHQHQCLCISASVRKCWCSCEELLIRVGHLQPDD